MPKGVYFHTPEHMAKVSSFIKHKEGSQTANWKGDKAKYQAIHCWLRKYKGRPKRCKLCGKTEGRLEWASKDGTHKRRLNHYFGACKRCHFKYDKIGEKMWKTRRRKSL